MIILFANLGFFGFWLYKMMEEVKSTLIKKLGKIYIMVCLCGHAERYDKMLKDVAINEENEILREKYMEYLRQLQLLYSENKMVLSKRTLEKVGLYLHPEKVLKAAGIDLNEIPLKEKEK